MNAFRTVTVLTLAFGALAAGVVGNWFVFGAVVALAALIFGPWLVGKYLWVRVPAMSAGLVYNLETKAFQRFLLPGRHLLHPLEHVKKVVSTAPGFVTGDCKAQTDGGVVVAVQWSLTYCLNPAAIEEFLQPNMANTLLKSVEPMLRTHMNNCVTYLFDQHSVGAVCAAGARQRLERELRDLVVERLAPFGIQTYRVILRNVQLPPDVLAAVEAAHKQEMMAHSEARALERLHQAVSKFSETDMERLLHLRQLQELGQNGVSLHVPTVAVMSGQAQPAVGSWPARPPKRTNGRTQKPLTSEQSPESWGLPSN